MRPTFDDGAAWTAGVDAVSLSDGRQTKSSWSTSRLVYWLCVGVIAGGAWSDAVRAQLPKPPSPVSQPTQNEATEVPEDPLGRTTPRGTVINFLTAAHAQSYALAAQYLDMRPRDKDADSLAEELFVVLDRRLPAKLNNLSNEPNGSTSDPLDSRRELVGTVASKNGPVDIYLVRVDRSNGASIWLFSRETLAAIPDIYAEIHAVAIENVLPEFLLQRFYGFSRFGWLFFLVLLPLGYLALSVANRLLSPLIGYVLRRLKKRPEITNPTVLPHPARLLMIAGGIQWLLYDFSMPLLARQVGSTTAVTMAIVALVWIAILVNGKCEGYFRRRLERTGRIGTAAILAPARRVVDFIAAVIGFMFLLHTVGINPSAALAGLGVGGIAVALAAQKTLENVIGGVSLIVDQAVRVGDFFKVGEMMGTVEAIGLRSTRVRTLDRTIVNIPNGLMATMAVENFSARDSFWLRHLVGLGFDTSPSALNQVLADVRFLLNHDGRVLPSSTRVLLLRFGPSSLELEIFAYVFAREWNHFLEIQEELLMQIRRIISANGAEIAYPVHTVHIKNEMEPVNIPSQMLQAVLPGKK
jgi:MscS family membrane protein